MNEYYYVEYAEPCFIYPKGAFVVRNERGKYIKDFIRKNKAEDYCQILNESLIN